MQFLFYFALAAGANYFTLYYRGLLVDGEGNPHYRIIGVLLMVQSVPAFLSPLAAGYVADRFQINNRLISLCSVLTALGTGLIILPGLAPFHSLSPASKLGLIFPGAVIGQFFIRPLTPLIDTGSLKALEEKEGHGDNYGRIRFLGSIGWIISCLIMGVWLDFSGRLVDAILVYALFYLVLALVSAGGFATEVKKVDLSWKYLLEDRILRVLFVIAVVRMIGFGMAFQFTGVYLSELNLSYTQMGMAFGLAAAMEVPFFFIGNRLLGRWGSKTLIMSEFLIQTLRFALFFFFSRVQNASFYIVVQMLTGMGVVLHVTGMIPLLNRIAPPHLKASYQTLYTVALALASIFNGLLAALIVDSLGTRALMGICGLVMTGAFLYTGLRLKLDFSLPAEGA